MYAPSPVEYEDLIAYARTLQHGVFGIVHGWSADVDAVELVVLMDDGGVCMGNLVGPRFVVDWTTEFEQQPGHVHDRYTASTYVPRSKLVTTCPAAEQSVEVTKGKDRGVNMAKECAKVINDGANAMARQGKEASEVPTKSNSNKGATLAKGHATECTKSSTNPKQVIKDVWNVARRLPTEPEVRAHKCLDYATSSTSNCMCEWHTCSSSTVHPWLALRGD